MTRLAQFTVILRRPPKAALEGWPVQGSRPSRLAALAPRDDDVEVRFASIQEESTLIGVFDAKTFEEPVDEGRLPRLNFRARL